MIRGDFKMQRLFKRIVIATISLIVLGCFLFIICANEFESKEIVLANSSSQAVSFNSLSCEEQLLEYHVMVERILYGEIEKSVNKIYGPGERTSWDYKIIEVKRGYYPDPFMYRITVEFETFVGAHNPLFDTNLAVYDIIDFNPFELKEISFEHHLTQQ